MRIRFRMRSAGIAFSLLSLSVVASAQPAGTFVPTGSMVVSRISYAATLLRNGRVLIAGGFYAPSVLASAEIFDPATGTFTLTGSMNVARVGPTATLLTDGRVLIAGGQGADAVENEDADMLTSAEIYDPAKGTFELTGSLPVVHYFGIAAALLNDGRVLIVGGDGIVYPNGEITAPGVDGGSAAIYDPDTGQFSSAGTIPMVMPAATPLADGRVLLVGTTADLTDNLALIYDPAAGAFNPTGSRIPHSIFPSQASGAATSYFSAAPLANGNVLLAGGEDGGPGLLPGLRNTAEIYDPSTGEFHETGSMPVAEGNFDSPTAAAFPGGRAVVAGYKAAVLYDPASGTFASLSYNTQGYSQSSTLLLDGTVLIIGGGFSLGEAWLYAPAPSAASSASLTAPLAPESFASIFGARLAGATASAADPQSPPTSLGGVGVNVRDSSGAEWPAPLLYVSASQINFEVPAGAALGNVTVEFQNGGNAVSAAAQVSRIAPGLFAIAGNIAAAYGTRIEPDGSQTTLPPDTPIVLDQRPMYLSLFGTGIRGLSSQSNVKVTIGGIDAAVSYAGAQGVTPCLDQVNVLLPVALAGAGKRPGRADWVDGVAAPTQKLLEFE